MWYGTGEADKFEFKNLYKNKLNLRFQISIYDGKKN